ncbi:hypothetical protein [Tissierella praeacuta]|uniref:hypothetical protein n=1 Tax=Tissierella praeacuta TaxID=43131 RepID=UPI00289D0F94|nr:hypothetical protein [Tissierella praeacuta]
MNVNTLIQYEMIGVSNITTSSNVLIRKSYQDGTNMVRFNDKDMYVIIINDDKADVWLNIHCIGNEWISIANQFNGKHLK